MAFIVGSLLLAGCGTDDAPSPAVAEAADPPPTAIAQPAPPAEEPASTIGFPSISLSDGADAVAEIHPQPMSGSAPSRAIIEALSPLQIMLGKWRGTTQRAVGDFNALDEPEWVWDFQTDRTRPELVMTSAASPYFRELRLGYRPGDGVYRLSMLEPAGTRREFVGDFSVPVEEFQGDDKRLHRRFKLELTEVDSSSPRDAWQIVFNQQDNDRYLVELSRRQGARFLRFDTVATQREGTSFGQSDADYGGRKCIISGGLGTIAVSYKGTTYYVCCSGCQAAFEEDPESWLAEAQTSN